VLPWFPEAGFMLPDGIGEPIGFPGDVVVGFDEDIGRGAIVIGAAGMLPPIEPPAAPPIEEPALVPVPDAFVPIVPLGPGLPPPATAVARQT
jgi:hypothetical protein